MCNCKPQISANIGWENSTPEKFFYENGYTEGLSRSDWEHKLRENGQVAANKWLKWRMIQRNLHKLDNKHGFMINPCGHTTPLQKDLKDYIAVSHCWGEQIIDPKLAVVLGNKFSCGVWIDTATSPDEITARKDMIRNMSNIYHNASAVVICTRIYDSDLPTSTRALNRRHYLFRLQRSGWNTRAWTWQEAALAKNLCGWYDGQIFWVRGSGYSLEQEDGRFGEQLITQHRPNSLSLLEARAKIIGRSATYEEDYINAVLGLVKQSSLHKASFKLIDGLVPKKLVYSPGERLKDKNLSWMPCGIQKWVPERIQGELRTDKSGCLILENVECFIKKNNKNDEDCFEPIPANKGFALNTTISIRLLRTLYYTIWADTFPITSKEVCITAVYLRHAKNTRGTAYIQGTQRTVRVC